ncbi:homeobox protein siamois-like [Xenopus laevis]|uniref:Homeobox protein siamois n=1 Tax=Xenopus laevis TaxID=8355 RepID=A0A8J0UNE7_XENLA|nr:homeobox protein siamois-like [Xenopus laevis]
MDCDIELEQVIGTALSLEDDYPELYLPIREKHKANSNSIRGTISDLLPAAQVQVPLQNSWQQTLLELYSVLGIPQEAKVSRTMHKNVSEDQSMEALSPGIKDKPCCISESSSCLKRPLCEEEQRVCKKTKSEPNDLLPSLSARSRKRTIYSKEQTNFLQNHFDVNPYPDFVSRCHIAQLTGISEPRIQVHQELQIMDIKWNLYYRFTKSCRSWT